MNYDKHNKFKVQYKMGISETPHCLYCNNTETIEHVYIECVNARQLWQDIENWVRILHCPQFIISYTEKLFGEKYNDYIKHIIVISIIDVIHQMSQLM